MQRRSKTVENAKLGNRFESIRKRLLDDQFSERLEKPLAFWVRTSDRSLPLALLDRTLGEVLGTPFPELTKTPGIGQKKIQTLVRLLRRASEADESSVDEIPEGAADDRLEGNGHFDASLVSEAEWSRWRTNVARFGLGGERIGRLASSLAEVPTVIWYTPLAEYLEYRLDDLRNLKNHGDKRVRVVLKVFHAVDTMLTAADPDASHLRIRLVPDFVAAIEESVSRWQRSSDIPTEAEVRDELIAHLLDQTRTDLGKSVENLAAARLGFGGPSKSVQQLARQSAITRARVYQLLEQCSLMTGVRWPEGAAVLRNLTATLNERRSRKSHDAPIALVAAAADLYFPDSTGNGTVASENGNSDSMPAGL